MILVTGGAGFVGSILVPMLLSEGHDVQVLDSLMYGGAGLLPCANDPNFQFRKGDIRSVSDVGSAMKGCDTVVHLAGIVGFPACRKDVDVSNAVNVMGSSNVCRCAEDRLLIFTSTGSVYGDISDVTCTEETPPKPISVYSQNKVAAEQYFLEKQGIVLRFATGFGVSLRPRLDLMVNDFVHKALNEKYLVIYEGHFMRTFIAVRDMARAILFALANADRMRGQIYNVGSQKMDLTKNQLCEVIRQKTGCYVHCADVDVDPDKRNCLISYDKVEALGYHTQVSIEEGVEELIAADPLLEVRNVYSNV